MHFLFAAVSSEFAFVADLSVAVMLIVVGHNDNRHLVRGWFVREFDGRNHVCYRWSGREALIRLNIPTSATTLRMMIAGTGLKNEPSSFSVYQNERISHYEGSKTDMWTIWNTSLAGISRGGSDTELIIRSEKRLPDGTFIPRAFIPDQYLKNGDPREMGIRVAAIRVL